MLLNVSQDAPTSANTPKDSTSQPQAALSTIAESLSSQQKNDAKSSRKVTLKNLLEHGTLQVGDTLGVMHNSEVKMLGLVDADGQIRSNDGNIYPSVAKFAKANYPSDPAARVWRIVCLLGDRNRPIPLMELKDAYLRYAATLTAAPPPSPAAPVSYAPPTSTAAPTPVTQSPAQQQVSSLGPTAALASVSGALVSALPGTVASQANARSLALAVPPTTLPSPPAAGGPGTVKPVAMKTMAKAPANGTRPPLPEAMSRAISVFSVRRSPSRPPRPSPQVHSAPPTLAERPQAPIGNPSQWLSGPTQVPPHQSGWYSSQQSPSGLAASSFSTVAPSTNKAKKFTIWHPPAPAASSATSTTTTSIPPPVHKKPAELEKVMVADIGDSPASTQELPTRMTTPTPARPPAEKPGADTATANAESDHDRPKSASFSVLPSGEESGARDDESVSSTSHDTVLYDAKRKAEQNEVASPPRSPVAEDFDAGPEVWSKSALDIDISDSDKEADPDADSLRPFFRRLARRLREEMQTKPAPVPTQRTPISATRSASRAEPPLPLAPTPLPIVQQHENESVMSEEQSKKNEPSVSEERSKVEEDMSALSTQTPWNGKPSNRIILQLDQRSAYFAPTESPASTPPVTALPPLTPLTVPFTDETCIDCGKSDAWRKVPEGGKLCSGCSITRLLKAKERRAKAAAAVKKKKPTKAKVVRDESSEKKKTKKVKESSSAATTPATKSTALAPTQQSKPRKRSLDGMIVTPATRAPRDDASSLSESDRKRQQQKERREKEKQERADRQFAEALMKNDLLAAKAAGAELSPRPQRKRKSPHNSPISASSERKPRSKIRGRPLKRKTAVKKTDSPSDESEEDQEQEQDEDDSNEEEEDDDNDSDPEQESSEREEDEDANEGENENDESSSRKRKTTRPSPGRLQLTEDHSESSSSSSSSSVASASSSASSSILAPDTVELRPQTKRKKQTGDASSSSSVSAPVKSSTTVRPLPPTAPPSSLRTSSGTTPPLRTSANGTTPLQASNSTIPPLRTSGTSASVPAPAKVLSPPPSFKPPPVLSPSAFVSTTAPPRIATSVPLRQTVPSTTSASVAMGPPTKLSVQPIQRSSQGLFTYKPSPSPPPPPPPPPSLVTAPSGTVLKTTTAKTSTDTTSATPTRLPQPTPATSPDSTAPKKFLSSSDSRFVSSAQPKPPPSEPPPPPKSASSVAVSPLKQLMQAFPVLPPVVDSSRDPRRPKPPPRPTYSSSSSSASSDHRSSASSRARSPPRSRSPSRSSSPSRLRSQTETRRCTPTEFVNTSRPWMSARKYQGYLMCSHIGEADEVELFKLFAPYKPVAEEFWLFRDSAYVSFETAAMLDAVVRHGRFLLRSNGKMFSFKVQPSYYGARPYSSTSSSSSSHHQSSSGRASLHYKSSNGSSYSSSSHSHHYSGSSSGGGSSSHHHQ